MSIYGTSPPVTTSMPFGAPRRRASRSTSHETLDEEADAEPDETSPEVVAVVFASHDDGEGARLFPLSSAERPPCLLPVGAGRGCTLLERQVALLTGPGLAFAHVVVVCDDRARANVAEALGDTQRNKGVELVVCDEGIGSADVLRQLALDDRLGGARYILALSADVVLADHVHALADVMRTKDGDACCLFTPVPAPHAEPGAAAKGKAPPKAPKRDPEDVEFVALAHADGRLLLKTPLVEVEEDGGGAVSVSKAMLARRERVTIRKDLIDARVCMLSRYALALLEARPSLPSLWGDCVPFLLRRQFRGEAALPPGVPPPPQRQDPFLSQVLGLPAPPPPRGGRAATVPDLARSVDTAAGSLAAAAAVAAGAAAAGGALGGAPFGGGGIGGGGADGGDDEGDTVRVFALVVGGPKVSESGAEYALRVNTLDAFAMASRDAILRASPAAYGPPPQGLKRREMSIVGDGVETGDKVTLKLAVVGEGAKLGSRCKINNTVIMAGAAVGDSSVLQHCVVSAGATVGKNCNLNKVQVGPGAHVADGTRLKDEAVFEDEVDYGG